MDLTYLAAKEWWSHWHEHACHVLPPADRKQHLSRMNEFFTWNYTGKVHERRLNEYLDDLAKRCSTWRDSLETFNLVFGNEPMFIPLKTIKRAKRIREPRHCVAATESQFQFIFKRYTKDGQDPDRAVLMLLLWECGMALVDATGLKWKDVDFDNSIIKADRNKTRTRFRVPIERDGRLYRLLQILKQDPDREEYVSPANHLQYFSNRQYINLVMRKHFREAGLPKGSLTHAFRRGFVTRMANAGVPATVIAQMSGHIDVGTMCAYFKPTDDDLREAIERADTHKNRPHQPTHVPTVGPAPGEQTQADDRNGNCHGERLVEANGR